MVKTDTFNVVHLSRMPMSIDATHAADFAPAAPARPLIHPLWVRLTHWINAAAIIVMVGSGWEIYNASPLFAFVFPPPVTLGRWLGEVHDNILTQLSQGT